MKTPGTNEQPMTKLELKKEKSQNDSQRSVTSRDHNNQEDYEIPTRLDTVFSQTSKKIFQNQLNKNPKVQQQTQGDCTISLPQTPKIKANTRISNNYRTNSLQTQTPLRGVQSKEGHNIMSASFKQLFDQIDEDPLYSAQELNKLTNLNLEAILASQKAAQKQLLQEQKEILKKMSPLKPQANFKSGMGKVYGIKGNPFKQQTITQDGRRFTQSILRPIIQQEIRQVNQIDKYQQLRMNGTPIAQPSKIKINQQELVPDHDIYNQKIFSPLSVDSNYTQKINIYKLLVEPQPSRLSNQVFENLSIPSSSILSQLRKDDQFKFKLQNKTETPKRQQVHSKLKPSNKIESKEIDMRQIQNKIIQDSDKLPIRSSNMNNQDLDMFKFTDTEAQDYLSKISYQNSFDKRSQLSNTFRQKSFSNQKYSELANQQNNSPLSLIGQKAPQGLRLEPIIKSRFQEKRETQACSQLVVALLTQNNNHTQNSSINEIIQNEDDRSQNDEDSLTSPARLSQTDGDAYLAIQKLPAKTSKILLTNESKASQLQLAIYPTTIAHFVTEQSIEDKDLLKKSNKHSSSQASNRKTALSKLSQRALSTQ